MANPNEFDCSAGCEACGGGCGPSFQPSDSTVTLTLDDDSTLECAVLTIYPAGEYEYIALLPLDENGKNTTGDVYLYRYLEEADGTPQIENIIEEEEYQIASKGFDNLLVKAGLSHFDEEK